MTEKNYLCTVDAENINNIVIEKLKAVPNNDDSFFEELLSITIPGKIDGKTVTQIGVNAFSNSSLSSISLPESLSDIWDSAFENCKNLVSVDNLNDNAKIHRFVFNGCSSLKKIHIPDNMEYIWEYSFAGCVNLTELMLPKKLKVISEFSFQNCYKLTKISIPEGVIEIKACAFKGCDSLNELVIPSSVKFIGEDAFADCPNLKIYGMPNSFAKEYATNHKIPFYYLNSLIIDNKIIKQHELSENVIGDGWEWIAKSRILRLSGYNGGVINRYGSDLIIELVEGTINTVSGNSADYDKYGISSHGQSVIIQGSGSITIDCVIEGIYATNEINIKSGTVTVSSKNHGIISRNNKVIVSGGTLYAYASSNHEACYAIYGKLECNGARIFVSRDNSSEPTQTDSYMRQKYACVTFDSGCTFEKAHTVFEGCTFGTNSQVITGNVAGNVIGSDNIINRSDISGIGNSSTGNVAGNVIGSDNIINRSDISGIGNSSTGNDNIIINKTKERNIPKNCPYCGEEIDDNAIFCSSCGKKLIGGE